jgi:hypothetical protein
MGHYLSEMISDEEDLRLRQRDTPQMWLLSFRYYAHHKQPNGIVSRVGPNDTIEVTEKHPAIYIANANEQLRKLQSQPYDQADYRADEITRLYSAVPIPEGTLTEDEMDALQ